MSQIKKTVTNLLARLTSLQNDDGSFGAHIVETGECTPTIFPTLLSFSILSGIQDALIKEKLAGILAKGVPFVANEIGSKNGWNYWRKGSENRQIKPYPNDLDDTSLAILALASNGTPSRHLENELDAYFCLLKQADCGFGGPFNTWIVPKTLASGHWQDVDPVVNANIAYCLSSLGISINSLNEYLIECLKRRNLSSKYYPNKTHVIYFLSRAAHTNVAKRDLDAIARYVCTKEYSDNTEMRSALSASFLLSTLVRLNAPDKKIKTAYLHLMNMLESSALAPIYLESSHNKIMHRVASEAVEISAAIEALTLYESIN